jgi:glycosyltransferase involved in cell wall biosynthesis
LKIAMLTGSLSRSGGGVYEIVRALSHALGERSDVAAFGMQDRQFATDAAGWEPAKVYAFEPFGVQSLAYAPGMSRALRTLAPDVVHQHGLWTYQSFVARRWRRSATSGVHMVTPQGMLDTWAMHHHAWRKRIFWQLLERTNLGEADCLNVNSEAELRCVRDLGLEMPVCIVPNGVDLPSNGCATHEAPWHEVWGADKKVLLFLGRLHPKKAVKELVHAWSGARRVGASEWRLAIVGWDEGGYGRDVNELIATLKISDEVRWFGPGFGRTKEASFRAADAFVLPSHSEGLPMAVLEAWSYSLPVIMTRECNLGDGFAAGAALEVRPEIDSMRQGIERLFAMTESELSEVGRRGRALVSQKYTWPKVAAQLESVYTWLLGRGSKPDCVVG